jgi:hypothetical protein
MLLLAAMAGMMRLKASLVILLLEMLSRSSLGLA